jgi:guanylate kinase
MIKRIIIVGKGASGKDYLRKILEDSGFIYCRSHTTRPIRKNEENGKDYFFIDEKGIPAEKDLYESVYFNGWFYGTSKEEFDRSNLFIMTPKGISQLKEEDRKASFIIYIEADEKSRIDRLSSRRDADDVKRRIEADEKDFLNFDDFDTTINNSQNHEEDINIKIKGIIDGIGKLP